MEKILVITYYWPPSGGGGVQRWVKFTKYLPKFNYTPIVLTVNENDASYSIIDKSLEKEISSELEIHKTKSREILQIFTKIFGKEKLPHSGFSGQKKRSLFDLITRFIRGNFFIPDPRIGWNKFAYKKAFELIKKHNIKYVITTSPPHSTQLIGLKLKKKANITWIADLRDPWTEIYFYKELLHTPLSKYIDSIYERKVIEKADQVIVVSKTIKKLFEEKINIKHYNKIKIIPNGYDEDDLKKIQINNNINNKEWKISYIGNLAKSYPGESFIEVLKEVVQNNPDIKIKFNFIGIYPIHLKEKIENLQLTTNIEFIDYIPHDEVFNHLLSTDSLLLAIPSTKNNNGILTGKLFEYLAAKKSILCIGPPNGDAAEIIEKCNSGKTFTPEDKKGMIKYINQLIINKQKGIKHQFNEEEISKYSREYLTKKLIAIMNGK